jgi:hypothetical protein
MESVADFFQRTELAVFAAVFRLARPAAEDLVAHSQVFLLVVRDLVPTGLRHGGPVVLAAILGLQVAGDDPDGEGLASHGERHQHLAGASRQDPLVAAP